MANRLASYLHLNRYGVYGLRITVPRDLQQRLAFREHRLTLRTKSRSEAKALAYSLSVRVRTLFACLRTMPDSEDKTPSSEFLELVAAERDRILAAHESAKKRLSLAEGKKESLGARYRQLFGMIGDSNQPLSLPEQMLAVLGRGGEEEPPTALEFALDALGVELQAIQLEEADILKRMAELAGDSEALRLRVEFHYQGRNLVEAAKKEKETLEDYTASLLRKVSAPAMASSPAQAFDQKTIRTIQGLDASASDKRLSELFDMYVEAHRRQWKNWQDRVNRDYFPVRDMFISIIGDLQLQELTPSHSRTFAEKTKRSEEAKGRTQKTISKKLSSLSAVFNWARQQMLVPDLTMPLAMKAESNSYEPFDRLELVTLFESDDYRSNTFGRSARFWLPLLGLYTGGRIEELASAKVAAVQDQDSIPGLLLSPDGQKTGKNDHSRRFVPFHPKLIECGFMAYVNLLRSEAHSDLFPCLPNAARDGKGKAASRDFGDYRRKLGIGTAEGEGRGTKTFHSFRTTLVTAMQNAGAQRDIRMAIVGHASSDVHDTVYSQGQMPPKLKLEALTKAVFDFNHPQWKDTEDYRYSRKNQRTAPIRRSSRSD